MSKIAEPMDGGAPPPTMNLFFMRLFSALLLDLRAYHSIAGDRYGTGQAAAVVCLSAIAQPSTLIPAYGAWALVVLIVFGLVRWSLFSGIPYALGMLLRTPMSEYRRYLRTLGFAEAPSILNFIVYELEEPYRTPAGMAVWLWMFAAAWVAIRAAANTTFWSSFLLAIVTFALYLAPPLILKP